jgi:hypothetical protein
MKQNSFAQLKETFLGFINEMCGIAPSPKQALKTYED